MQTIERILSIVIVACMLFGLFAGLSLPVGCPYCIQILINQPQARDGDINIFASADRADRSVVAEIQSHLPEARHRLEKLFPDYSDGRYLRTDIIVAPRERLGPNADFAGAMQGSLLGPPIIMLPKDTVRPGVTSHELVHAYLANRLGAFRSAMDMPHWFNEGLAMQVDYSHGFGPDVLCYLSQLHGWPSVTQLRYPYAFYHSETQEEQVLRYAWSKAIVQRMMSADDFLERLDRFFEGESWKHSFEAIVPVFERSMIC